jgi:hypothetical protein
VSEYQLGGVRVLIRGCPVTVTLNLLLANSTLYIETIGWSVLLISYIDTLKLLGLEQFLFNSSYVPNSFNNELLIIAYSIMVLIYIDIVARCSIPI